MGGVTVTSGSPPASDVALRPYRRHWLAVAGVALIAVSLLPPLGELARRYLFAESIQFCVFAMAGPALIVLGAPWRLLHLSQAEPSGARDTGPGPADRLAAGRRRHPSSLRPAFYLAAFIGVCFIWRWPGVLDELARHPWLIAAELVTLFAAGTGLWLELVTSSPFRPRLGRPHRAVLATLAMWFIWGAGYVLGFFHAAVVHAYDPAGGWLGTVADQEVTAGLLWAIAGFCFVPVIYMAMLAWLRDGDDLGQEVRGGSGPDGRITVRGWDRPAGHRGRRPA
jgi:cytochrome c oxidase assembly factor CtaG